MVTTTTAECAGGVRLPRLYLALLLFAGALMIGVIAELAYRSSRD